MKIKFSRKKGFVDFKQLSRDSEYIYVGMVRSQNMIFGRSAVWYFTKYDFEQLSGSSPNLTKHLLIIWAADIAHRS